MNFNDNAVELIGCYGSDETHALSAWTSTSRNLTEKKRVYFSDYGFANSREVIRGDTDKLEKNPINFDKFYQENLIKWWKNKASKRYESLKSSGSLRTELEVWTKDMHIDIIR